MDEETMVLEQTLAGIPAITVKKVMEENTIIEEMLPEESTRVLPVLPFQICDIYLSELVNLEYSSAYTYRGILYKYVKIVGTIVKKIIKSEDKICIAVDDGTAVLYCYMENNKFGSECRSDIERRLEECCSEGIMESNELQNCAEMNYKEFFENIRNRERSFMNGCCKLFGEKILKSFTEYPLVSEINIGDNVKIKGIVSDFNKYRFMFIENLRQLSSVEETVYEMSKILDSKDKLYSDSDN